MHICKTLKVTMMLMPFQVVDELKLTFEQWTGSPAARLIKDAATNQPTGHALVALSSPEHASFLAKDMSEMIFMYAGAPRPLEAKVAIPGEAHHALHASPYLSYLCGA